MKSKSYTGLWKFIDRKACKSVNWSVFVQIKKKKLLKLLIYKMCIDSVYLHQSFPLISRNKSYEGMPAPHGALGGDPLHQVLAPGHVLLERWATARPVSAGKGGIVTSNLTGWGEGGGGVVGEQLWDQGA